MPEELNSEEVSQETPDIVMRDTETPDETKGESSEGTKKESSPAPSEEVKEQSTQEESSQEQYTKERFNGLMSSWQKDRTKLQALETKETEAPKGDDALVDYLRTKIKERDMAERKVQDDAVATELSEVMATSPDFSKDEILKTAIKYSKDENNPISLKTAVNILSDIKASKGLTQEEAAKKKAAGTVAGRAAYQTSAGVRKYDPEKDKDKNYDELVEDAIREEGK